MTPADPPPAPPPAQPPAVRNEQVLSRQLSSVQQTMMAFGGAIGTGMFLATGLSVSAAGPAVVVSYGIVAAISLLLGRAVSEMAVAHPTAGAFGVYADVYLSPFFGYAVRVSYWAMEVIATGAQLVAASIYMRFWFPHVPGPVWGFGFAAVLLFVNSRAVSRLGVVEYWLVMIKLVAVVLFIGIAVLFVLGLAGEPAIGTHHLTGGGFAPFGGRGIWFGCCFVIYSFIGVEIVGVTSGEAADPGRTIPRAIRRLVLGLSAFYIVTITLLAALVPWQQIGVDKSPFVTALTGLGIPAAAGIMNFVVLIAALSSANANLYLISRTLFSLARAGFAPRSLGAITHHGAPVNALLASGVGLGAAVLVQVAWPETAYQKLFGISLFGALFVWLMIFATHIAFRRAARRSGQLPRAIVTTDRPVPGYQAYAVAGSYLGATAIAALLLSTWWVPILESTLVTGVAWLALILIGYLVSSRATKR